MDIKKEEEEIITPRAIEPIKNFPEILEFVSIDNITYEIQEIQKSS